MTSYTYQHSRQSEDWHPHGIRRLCRTTSFFIYENTTNNWRSNHCVNGQNSFVGGGDTNIIFSTLGSVDCANISGGWNNTISDDGIFTAFGSFVGGGAFNIASGRISTIAGGSRNVAFGRQSFIGGGSGNSAGGCGTAIGGGDGNAAFAKSQFSFISGGQHNNVGIAGGNGAQYSGIGGGYCNVIDDSAAIVFHSGIFGGFCNTVSGSCSAILGGANNNDNGFPFTGMYGNGLTAASVPGAPSSFWVDTLVAPNIPAVNAVGYLTLPVGALYTDAAALPGFTNRTVYVR